MGSASWYREMWRQDDTYWEFKPYKSCPLQIIVVSKIEKPDVFLDAHLFYNLSIAKKSVKKYKYININKLILAP